MAITMKEIESKLDELRRENFSLKLRLYMIEKNRNGPAVDSYLEDEEYTYANATSWTQTEIIRKSNAICQTENSTNSVAVQCEILNESNIVIGDTVENRLNYHSANRDARSVNKSKASDHYFDSSSRANLTDEILEQQAPDQSYAFKTSTISRPLPASCPVTPSNDDDFESDNIELKMPGDAKFTRAKQANLSRCSKLLNSDLAYSGEQLNNNSTAANNMNENNNMLTSKSSSSSSLKYQNNNHPACPYGMSVPNQSKSLQSMPIKMNLNQVLAAPSVIDGQAVSSPDLGLGDSDGDLVALGGLTLRAYLPLRNYQILRRNVSEALCVVGALSTLRRDFDLKFIEFDTFSEDARLHLGSLENILTASKTLCRSFTIEDATAVYEQIDKLRYKKENIEKAMTRNMRKADKLLKKASINLEQVV